MKGPNEAALRYSENFVSKSDVIRNYVSLVDPRYTFAVLMMSSRILLDFLAKRKTTRTSLVHDVTPWHMSQATAYRTVDKFKQAGFLECHGTHMIPSSLFFERFNEFATSQAAIIGKTFRESASFVIRRRSNNQCYVSEGVMEFLGFSFEEMLGTTTLDITHDTTMNMLGGIKRAKHFIANELAFSENKINRSVRLLWVFKHKNGNPVFAECEVGRLEHDGVGTKIVYAKVISESVFYYQCDNQGEFYGDKTRT